MPKLDLALESKDTTTGANESAPIRVLIVQTGSFDDVLAALATARQHYPRATYIGLVASDQVSAARRRNVFAEIHAGPSDPDDPASAEGGWQRQVDVCVLPFRDRFGIQYWTWRWWPVRHGIRRIAFYNNRGRLHERSLPVWMAETILVTAVGRVLLAVARHVWGQVRRWGDIAGVFGLALSALVLKQFQGRRRSREPLTSPEPLRVVLFIPSLGLGGAQRQLTIFLRHLDRRRWAPEVVTTGVPDRFFEPAVRALGVPITYLDAYRTFEKVGLIVQLVRHLRANPCHVLHGWLHYAAAFGAIAGCLSRVPVVIGSLRSERPNRFPWFFPRWQRFLDILTGPLQNCVIANSQAVRKEHRRWAWVPERRMLTVYNGIETSSMTSPPPDLRVALRRQLGCSAGAACIGIAGRLSPEKDHRTFLAAAAILVQEKREVQFLIIGDGPLRGELEAEIERLGLRAHAAVLGQRQDVLSLLGILDVLVLTSVSEGLPNVLLEGAAVGVPIVTTAAGGAVEIIVDGESGFVVPCGNASAVARAVGELLDDERLRKRFIAAGIDRVRKQFDASRMAAAIQRCYEFHAAGESMT